MLLQWTLLQLASLGIDDGNKNLTGSIPNLAPFIGANPLIRPPPIVSQLLLPGTPAEVSPPPATGCANHSSQLTPAPALSHETASVPDIGNSSMPEGNISTITTQPVTTTVTPNGGSKLIHQGDNDGTREVTSASVLNTNPPSETTTPTPPLITTLTSTNGSASVVATDAGNTPKETTTIAPPTTQVAVSGTTPKEVKEDIMKVTPTADNATEHPYETSEYTPQQTEVLDTTGVTTLPPMKTTAVPVLPLTATPLPTSLSEIPVGLPGDEEASEPNLGEAPSNATAAPASESSPETGDSQPLVPGDVLTSYLGVPVVLQDSATKLAPDTVRPAAETMPGITSGGVETRAYFMSGGNEAAEQGTLEQNPGSDTVISAAANEDGIPAGIVATPLYVLTGGNDAGLTQQATLGLIPGKDTVISAPGNANGSPTGFVTTASHMLTGANAEGGTQQESPEITPGSDKVIMAPAIVPGISYGGIAPPPQVITGGTAEGPGTLGLIHGSAPILSGSENLPGLPTGLVGMPPQLTAASMAALLAQGMQGLKPGSAHIGNPMLSQLQPSVPLEQVLAPIISALLMKEWQEHPQYRFGRSVNRFETEKNTRTSFKKEEQRLSDLTTRYKRGTGVGDLFTRYQIVKSVIDKFMDMRPKTQNFLVKQGVKLTAKKVGEMLKSYGPQMKEWINEKISSFDMDPSASMVGEEVDTLVTSFADTLENYIETLPH